MKQKYFITLLVIVFSLWGCAQKYVPPKILTPIEPPEIEIPSGDQLFSEAEDLYLKEFFVKALNRYMTYVDLYKEGPLADAALIKIGSIYTHYEDFDNARSAYRRLISIYPDSPLVLDAMIETLDTYNRQEKYRDTINYSFDIPEETLSSSQMFRKYNLIGDAYMGVDSPADAFYFYSRVYHRAGEFEKNRMLEKMKTVLSQLNRVHIDHLLSRVDDPAIRGYLLYRMGLTCVETGKVDYGLNALVELTEKIPGHEMAQPARNLLDEIFSKAISSPFTVGCLLPLSGPYKTFGHKALRGIELAFHQHVSGNNPARIRLVVKDTQSDPFRTVLAVQELDNENAAAIIGPMVMSEPAALEAQARGIPIVTFTQKDNITAIGDFVFRNFITPIMQARALAAFAIESLGINRFAILYPDEHYGTTYMNLFWNEIDSLGGKIAAVESYSPEQTDFATPIKKLVGLYYEIPEDLKLSFDLLPEEESLLIDEFDPGEMAPIFPTGLKRVPDLYYQLPQAVTGPIASVENQSRNEEEEPIAIVDFNAVFIPDAPSKAGLIIPQLAFHDVDDVYLLGTNLWHTDNLIEMSRQYVQNAVITEGFSPKSDSDRVRQFVHIYENTFSEKPEYIEAVSYDSARLLFHILSRPGIHFKDHVKDEMLNVVDYPGVTGTTHFDYSGDVMKKPYLLRIKGNRFMPIQDPILE